MSQAVAQARTVGSSLFSSDAVKKAVDTIVDEVAAASAKLTGVRGPIEGLEQPYEDSLKKLGEQRGRPLYYPYVGSGAGNGFYVELADGSVKIDMVGGIGYTPLGHAHPELIRAAVTASMEDNLKHGHLQATGALFEFSDKLLTLAQRKSKLAHIFVSAGGALANENAIKICYQKHAPASRVIAFSHCFMGRTVTMAQIGDAAGNRQGVPLSTQVDYMDFWNAAEADRVGQQAHIDAACRKLQEYIDRYPRQHACFIFELVQGEGGFVTAPREYFVALMELCRKNSIAVWADEIQSFNRTTELFAFEMLDLGEYIDVLTVGKATQACATLYTADYNPKPSLLSGTFTGATPEFAVGKRVLEILEASDLYGPGGMAAKHHKAFRDQVGALKAKHRDWFPDLPCGIAGGVGGMMRFTPFGGDKEKVGKATKVLFEEGLVTFYNGHGPYHIRFLPPLAVMSLEDWPTVFEVVERGLARVAAG
ncbi:MAG: aminotransferase class III-fold pyridoxal phosphate-dependent enzyme [Phycisphaeraceae bacterium]|nr:MAG: aminotransferase class III-fold pyridoxal phosphate-dependent enzyme [Phycisphaeraceae bacterium]